MDMTDAKAILSFEETIHFPREISLKTDHGPVSRPG
jgi:hypothetical protein